MTATHPRNQQYHAPRPLLGAYHDSSSPSKQSEAAEAQNGSSSATVSARRLKKREIDRRCQRQARERTKSRIAYLEGLVESLKKADVDDRSSALMRRIEQTEKERDALAQTLRDVQRALSSCRVMDEKVETDDDTPLLKHIQRAPADSPKTEGIVFDPSGGMVRGGGGGEGGFCYRADAVPAMAAMMPMSTPLIPQPATTNTATTTATSLPMLSSASVMAPVPPLPTSAENAVVPDCDDNCDCCREGGGKPLNQSSNHWRYMCSAVQRALESQTLVVTPQEDLLADDIPVRALLEGWDTAEQQFGMPSSWSMLRQVDERVFMTLSPTMRLANLLIMHRLCQYHIDPSPERYAKLPHWYHPRPSCQTQKHSFAINYFPWPGIRERFVFYQHRYCGNIFWKMIASCLALNWPYEFRDCFAQRWDTGSFVISPQFRECIDSIYNWQVTPDFFIQYPELRSDIPCSLDSPRPMSNPVQLQLAHWSPPAQQGHAAKKAAQRHEQHRQPNPMASAWDMQVAPPCSFPAPNEAAVVNPAMISTWII